MKPVERIHEGYAASRRVRVLADHLVKLLPSDARVLDIGCGDGTLDALVLEERPDLSIDGIDLIPRPGCRIDVIPFDGERIPFADGAYDVVTLIDVLHHCDPPEAMLSEARRVARRNLVIKDHFVDGHFAAPLLRFMDRVGNARHGVPLPYNYWTRERWDVETRRAGLRREECLSKLQLYPAAVDWIFGRSLHFLARYEVLEATARSDAADEASTGADA